MTDNLEHVDNRDRKSPNAFRTIGETAEIIGVAQHVLRFWESKIPHIKPLKHHGRRYYKPDDIAVLQKVKTLLYEEGYTVKGVQHSLNNIAVDKNQPDVFSVASMSLFNDQEQYILQEMLRNLYHSRDLLVSILLNSP